jgi:hypothetical protein
MAIGNQPAYYPRQNLSTRRDSCPEGVTQAIAAGVPASTLLWQLPHVLRQSLLCRHRHQRGTSTHVERPHASMILALRTGETKLI